MLERLLSTIIIYTLLLLSETDAKIKVEIPPVSRMPTEMSSPCVFDMLAIS
jgi:hypothetical protein